MQLRKEELNYLLNNALSLSPCEKSALPAAFISISSPIASELYIPGSRTVKVDFLTAVNSSNLH